MIPVAIKPEPDGFDVQVRKKGEKFLSETPKPVENDWKGKTYWRSAIPELRSFYGGICSYCAEWIAPITGARTVDHYIPKSLRPDLAYEWNNFRLACLQMNTNKGNFQDVLDPFSLQENWFHLDLNTFMILPNPALGIADQQKVWDTINRLKLNSDEECVISRQEWINEFKKRGLPFFHIQEKAPFIALELVRQGFASGETI